MANFNPSFPIFTLCGILISEKNYETLNRQVIEMKNKYWGEKKVILHSRDIRKFDNGFEILFDPKIKKSFYEDINTIMSNNFYTIICSSIMKEKYIKRYGRLQDVYGVSLSFIIERAVFFLDDRKDSTAELQVVVEKRGKKEDASLLNYYNKILDSGTGFVNSQRIKNYFKRFDFSDKRENIAGLQIADLAAYPITRYVLDNDAFNQAFEIIKDKIYTKNGKRYGLKIFP